MDTIANQPTRPVAEGEFGLEARMGRNATIFLAAGLLGIAALEASPHYLELAGLTVVGTLGYEAIRRAMLGREPPLQNVSEAIQIE